MTLLIIQPWFDAPGHPAQSLRNTARCLDGREGITYLVWSKSGDAVVLPSSAPCETFRTRGTSIQEGTLRALFVLRRQFRTGGLTRSVLFLDGHLVTRAFVRACEAEGVAYFTHDRGRDPAHFELFENRLPYDRQGMANAIRCAWVDASYSECETLAERFYRDRRDGVPQAWISYTTAQTTGRLPEHWNHGKRNLVAFVSSEDELQAIGGEWRNHVYATQCDGLVRISTEIASVASAHLYVRLHPNLVGNRSRSMQDLVALASARVTVIAPESDVSTYVLLDHAEKVLSFGSTMGIEAAFWGKPSIVAGPAPFSGLGSTVDAASHDEVMRALLSDNVTVPPRLGALMYGYYEQTRGIPFKHFRADGLWDGRFKGERIKPGVGYRAIRWLGGKRG